MSPDCKGILLGCGGAKQRRNPKDRVKSGKKLLKSGKVKLNFTFEENKNGNQIVSNFHFITYFYLIFILRKLSKSHHSAEPELQLLSVLL